MSASKNEKVYVVLELSQDTDRHDGEGISDVIEAYKTVDDAIEAVSEWADNITLKYDRYHNPYWESDQFEDDEIPVFIRYRIKEIDLN